MDSWWISQHHTAPESRLKMKGKVLFLQNHKKEDEKPCKRHMHTTCKGT